jgi:hypothetical protein
MMTDATVKMVRYQLHTRHASSLECIVQIRGHSDNRLLTLILELHNFVLVDDDHVDDEILLHKDSTDTEDTEI